MPELGVYLVNPASRAATAATLMCSGVSKSGSPAPKPQTSIPSDFIALALLSIERVREGVKLEALEESCIKDCFQDYMCLSVFSTKEFESGERVWNALARVLGFYPLGQHGYPFSAGSSNLNLPAKFVNFFGDLFDLVPHQTGDDEFAERLHGRPESRGRFSEEVAIEVGGNDIESSLRAVLQDIGTDQFQSGCLVQTSIRFRHSNSGSIKIEGEDPFGSEAPGRDGQNAGPGARIEKFPRVRFRRDIS